MTYAIKNKTNFFGGFDKTNQPKWVSAKDAIWWSKEIEASAQAMLLKKFDKSVQKRPVVFHSEAQ